jgi:Flp pilus assembly protein TadB
VNPLLMLAVAGGGLLGVGFTVAGTAFGPRHPVLADALAALDERRPRPSDPAAPALVRVLRHLPGTVPDADLDMIGWDRDRFLVARVGRSLRYAAAGPALGSAVWILDLGLPLVVPAGLTVVGALLGWTSSAQAVSHRAEDAREQLRFALVSYLQQVGLLRHGGAGVSTALTLPAQLLPDGWAMRRIADELAHAERSGLMPWDGLRRFGERVGVDELTDLSAIAASAGHDGGAIVDTLLARAGSLRDELLADEHTDANRASGQMSTPGALQVFLIAAWVLFPAGVALLSL